MSIIEYIRNISDETLKVALEECLKKHDATFIDKLRRISFNVLQMTARYVLETTDPWLAKYNGYTSELPNRLTND